jgi:hypothetical protein
MLMRSRSLSDATDIGSSDSSDIGPGVPDDRPVVPTAADSSDGPQPPVSDGGGSPGGSDGPPGGSDGPGGPGPQPP